MIQIACSCISLSIGRISAGAAMDLGEGPDAMATSTLTVIFTSCAGYHPATQTFIIAKAENSRVEDR